jgi:proteic killer suppression protein
MSQFQAGNAQILCVSGTAGTTTTSNGALTHCIAWRYNLSVIRSFRHKSLEDSFHTGSKAGIQPAHAARLRRQLAKLDSSRDPRDMDIPGWRLHSLSGDLASHWSVWVNGHWRVTFTFERQHAARVDYRDYH